LFLLLTASFIACTPTTPNTENTNESTLPDGSTPTDDPNQPDNPQPTDDPNQPDNPQPTDDPNQPDNPQPTDDPNQPESEPEKPPTSITPLPPTSFVFARYTEERTGQIYLYDIQTQQERPLLTLEGKGAESPQLAISPDRKWIAMIAYYKPTASEIATGYKIPSIWKIAADGTYIQRLSQPIPVPAEEGSCVTKLDCNVPKVCNAKGRCQFDALRFQLTQPQWSGDSKTIWTSFGQFYTGVAGLTGGLRPASLSAEGGTLQIYNTTASCQIVGYSNIHPTSNRVVAVHGVCQGATPSGLFAYNTPPQGAGEELLANTPNFDISLATPIFTLDGSGLLFKATTDWDTNNDGQPDTRGEGIIAASLQSGQLNGLLPPPGDGIAYDSFALSPDGNRIAACLANYNQRIYNLIIADFTVQNPQDFIKILSRDGKSCMPTW
jgi:hypothetical protein